MRARTPGHAHRADRRGRTPQMTPGSRCAPTPRGYRGRQAGRLSGMGEVAGLHLSRRDPVEPAAQLGYDFLEVGQYVERADAIAPARREVSRPPAGCGGGPGPRSHARVARVKLALRLSRVYRSSDAGPGGALSDPVDTLPAPSLSATTRSSGISTTSAAALASVMSATRWPMTDCRF